MPQESGYIGRSPGDSTVTKATQVYNVTSPTSTFTFRSGYDVGYFEVYINGLRQVQNEDYTAGDGTTFVLTTPVGVGTVVEASAFKAFNIGNVSNAGNDFEVANDLIVGGNVTATAYFGDGSNLTNVGAGSILNSEGNLGIGSTAVIITGPTGWNLAIGNTGVTGNQSSLIAAKGSHNVSIGQSAGCCLTTANFNILIGQQAGRNTTTGSYSVFFGRCAGLSNTSGESNIFIGSRAGRCNTTGNSNNFLGKFAGLENTTGVHNNFLGSNAGASNTTGENNQFIGRRAGNSNTDGCNNVFMGEETGRYFTASNNVAIGQCALFGVLNQSTGENNIAIGQYAGMSNTTGSYNNFLGRYAGCSNTKGENNNFFGQCAGFSNTTGNNNNFFGLRAGLSNTTGVNNTFAGFSAGQFNTSGSTNVFLGPNAGCRNTTGSCNVAAGGFALACNISGQHNIALGHFAGVKNGNSSCNIYIGQAAGRCAESGCNNVFLGAKAGCTFNATNNIAIGQCALHGVLNESTGTDNIVMGALAGFSNTTGCFNNFIGRSAGCSNTTGSSNNFFGANAGCNVTIGDCNIVIGPRENTTGAGATNEVWIDSGSARACFGGSDSSWTFPSDCRDKCDIQDMAFGRCFLGQLRPRTYTWNWREGTGTQTKDGGFIAQEIKEAVDSNPGSEDLNIVKTDNPDQWMVSKEQLIPVLVKAIQELNEENDILKAELQAIKEHLGL